MTECKSQAVMQASATTQQLKKLAPKMGSQCRASEVLLEVGILRS